MVGMLLACLNQYGYLDSQTPLKYSRKNEKEISDFVKT